MRLVNITQLAAVAVVSCGDIIDTGFSPGPPVPPERLIQLEVEWPLARVEGFVGANWTLYAAYANEEDTVGEIGPSGRFTVEYETACFEGEATGRWVEVSGRFESAPEFWSDCSLGVPDKCVSGIQRIVVPESDRRACQPPADG